MGKRGFTLVELLSVIVVLAIVMTIAVPSIAGVTNSIKKNMIEKKITMIEEAATLFGQDIKGSIISSPYRYNGYACKSYVVSKLVPNYLDSDNNNPCLDSNSSGTVGCIVDPSDKNNYLDKYEVIIYYKNKRIHAVVDALGTLECS